ncbi:MAG: DUF1499 domain-containing protein [Acidobacteriota bacterium]
MSQATRLKPCRRSPNCVTSRTPRSAKQRIDPLPFDGPAMDAWDRIKALVAALPRTEIVEQEATPGEGFYLRAEVRSALLRFVDDLELEILPGEQAIHFRSASRTGYSDLGVNRKRLAGLARAFTDGNS